jgi:hypothetical protein
MQSVITSEVKIPDGTPRIGVHVRMVDGVPVLFTERGELVNGQVSCSVAGAVDCVVTADVKINLERQGLP